MAYGIQNEQSDIRAHVSVVTKTVYVFPTQRGIEAIDTGKYPKAPAWTEDILTAEGYLVPPDDIKNMRRVPIPEHVLQQANFSPYDTTSEKGARAVRVVQYLLRNGLFPLWAHPTIIHDVDMQVEGLDIIVKMNTRIQVKCDYRAGDKEAGGTGNLYLQVAECNPFKMY